MNQNSPTTVDKSRHGNKLTLCNYCAVHWLYLIPSVMFCFYISLHLPNTEKQAMLKTYCNSQWSRIVPCIDGTPCHAIVCSYGLHSSWIHHHCNTSCHSVIRIHNFNLPSKTQTTELSEII